MLPAASRWSRGVLIILILSSVAFLGTVTLRYDLATSLGAHRGRLQSPVQVVDFSRQKNGSGSIEEHEDVLFDGVRRFVRSHSDAKPDLMFLVLTKDESSWGYDTRHPDRTFADFLELINATQVDLQRVSLGMMTASEKEYNLYRRATALTPLPRVTILLKKPDKDPDRNLWTSIPRGGRHTHAFQTARRSKVAALRNELMSRTINDERHLVWIDSDIKYLSPGIVQQMIFHSDNREDAGIMTARCQSGWNPDYDANSWAGSRSKSPSSGRGQSIPSSKDKQIGQKHVTELIHGTTDQDIVHLDSIGGVILYMRSSLVHQGLIFPPYYVIGTEWHQDGWDGLETEGLCYLAGYLGHNSCYVLGGQHHVEHTSN